MSPSPQPGRAQGTFLLMILLSWIAGSLPLVGAILDWFVTYFHEVSHGIISILTGGHVSRLALLPNGSGFVLAEGGVRVATLLAGYAGAFLWGALLYISAFSSSGPMARIVGLALVMMMGLTGLVWAEAGDATTFLILLTLMAVLGGGLVLGRSRFARHAIMFLGVYVLVRGLDLTLNLHGVMGLRRLPDSARHNDAVFLAEITGIAPRVWTFAWVALGVLVLYRLWVWAATVDARGAWVRRTGPVRGVR